MEPAEARTVEWFTGGVGLRAIAHRLNAEQIPFPAEPTRRGARRKGWASSAVRVILLNEKYVGRWVYGRRIFVKDPLTGRRQARLRPRAERQVSEHPDLRLVEPDVWETVQEKFRRQAASYPRSRGRLAGRTAGSPSGRASLFSGVLQCAGCGGTLVVVSGDPHRAERRYGCGFHREKGSHVCANPLTVKIATVERRLLEAIRTKILSPEAVRYLITAVNQHLDAFRATEGEARRRLEQGLQQVEEELLNVERAILAGVVSETTAALVQDREARIADGRADAIAPLKRGPRSPDWWRGLQAAARVESPYVFVTAQKATERSGWIEDYNTRAPHSALGMRSPVDYRAAATLSSSR